jgi:hypothetical protein
MNTFDIVLMNIICYMGGMLSGLGMCFKFRKHLLLKTSSNEQLNDILTSIHGEIDNTTNAGPPIADGQPTASAQQPMASAQPMVSAQPIANGQTMVLASAPPQEFVIRTL